MMFYNQLLCQLKSVDKFQLIENFAARLLTKTRKREHITFVLPSLHWLPIDFKVILLVLKAQWFGKGLHCRCAVIL